MVVNKNSMKNNTIKDIQSEYSGGISRSASNNSETEDMKKFFKYGSLSGLRTGVTTESFERELGFPVKDRSETKLYKSGFIKTAAGETAYVDTQFYTPRLSGETWFLPRSRKMLLRWVKVYFDYDPYIKSILTMHSRYPISPFKLVDSNREKIDLFESVLHQDDWDILDTMLKGSLSMQKYGEACLLGSFDREYGIWNNISPLDPTLIEVEEIPMSTKVNIYTEIPDKYKKIFKDNLNKTEVLKTLPEEILNVLKLGGDYIQLDTQESGYLNNYKPASAVMLANSTDVGEGGVRGTPPILSLLRTLVYKDFLKKAQFERAKRYAYPLEIWSLGRISENTANSIIPDDEDLEYVRGMLKQALANPPYTVIYNPLLNYQVFGATGALLNITEDLNFCENDMLVGLGVNKTIVLGEGSWLGTSKTIPLQRLLMDYQTDRDMWETKFLKNYVFRALCMRWGYTQEQKITGRRKILTPKVVWNRDLDPEASDAKRKDYMTLWEKKLISSETLVARYPDIDIYEEAKKLAKESMTYIGQLRGLNMPKINSNEVPKGDKPNKPAMPEKPNKEDIKEDKEKNKGVVEDKKEKEIPLQPPPKRPKEKIKVVPDGE